MIAIKKIPTSPDLTFDVMVCGDEDAPLVLLLHGFAESFSMWRSQMPPLATMGYRPVAPSQRGYSAGARPDTREPSDYGFDHLIKDAHVHRIGLRPAPLNVFTSLATIGAAASLGVLPTVIPNAWLL